MDAATALGDERDQARALSFLGLIARDRGDYSTAFDMEMRTLAIRERIGVDLAGTLRNLALICLDLGDDNLTRKYFSAPSKPPRAMATASTIRPRSARIRAGSPTSANIRRRSMPQTRH